MPRAKSIEPPLSKADLYELAWNRPVGMGDGYGAKPCVAPGNPSRSGSAS